MHSVIEVLTLHVMHFIRHRVADITLQEDNAASTQSISQLTTWLGPTPMSFHGLEERMG